MKSEPKPKLKAYLYHRVSKKIQVHKGEGIQRQNDMAMRFLESHPEYEVADIVIDEGLSAWYAKNTQKDAGLGGFIHLAESRPRKIPEDSCLIVESIDRISRLGTQKGSDLINRIFAQKIDIAVTKFGTIFRHNDENDLGGAIQLLSGLFLGKMESDQKSQRIKATKEIKRKEARKKGGLKFRPKVHPSWMKINSDKRSYTLIPKKVAVVQKIYDHKFNGLGIHRIINELRNEGIKPISGRKHWTITSVNNLLRSIAVKGEYQPKSRNFVEVDEDDKTKGWVKGQQIRVEVNAGDVIKDYYPRIIDDIRFNAVQDSFIPRASTQALSGRISGYKNLFRHLTKCFVCGSPMSAKKTYLVCGNTTLNCENRHINYEPLEKTLLEFFGSEDFLSPMSKVTFEEDNDVEIEKITNRIDEIEGAKRQLNKSLGFTENENSMKDMVRQLDSCNEELTELNIELDTLTEHKVVNFMEVSHIEDVDFEDTDERRKFNTILLDFIDYIKLYTGGYMLIKMRGSNTAFLKKSQFQAFQIVAIPPDEEEEYRKQYKQSLKDEVRRKPKKIRVVTTLSKVKQEMLNEFDEHNKIEQARLIYQRKIDERLSRKQTTRIFTRLDLGLTDEEHSQLRLDMDIPYKEDLKKYE